VFFLERHNEANSSQCEQRSGDNGQEKSTFQPEIQLIWNWRMHWSSILKGWRWCSASVHTWKGWTVRKLHIIVLGAVNCLKKIPAERREQNDTGCSHHQNASWQVKNPDALLASIMKASEDSGHAGEKSQAKHHHGMAFNFLIAIVRVEQKHLNGKNQQTGGGLRNSHILNVLGVFVTIVVPSKFENVQRIELFIHLTRS